MPSDPLAPSSPDTPAAPLPVDALLLVDLQLGVLDGVPAAATVVDTAATLLRLARAAGATVVHVQNDGTTQTGDEPGSPGWRLHPAVAPIEGEPVLRKTGDDGFADGRLAALLGDAAVQRVAICGVLSEMCVSATARGALDRGLGVVLPRDGHATTDLTTFDLGVVPAAVVARVAEHALGDGIEPCLTDAVRFVPPARRSRR